MTLRMKVKSRYLAISGIVDDLNILKCKLKIDWSLRRRQNFRDQQQEDNNREKNGNCELKRKKFFKKNERTYRHFFARVSG